MPCITQLPTRAMYRGRWVRRDISEKKIINNERSICFCGYIGINDPTELNNTVEYRISAAHSVRII